MVKNWIGVKEDIERLYHVDNKPLAEVMRLIKGLHGFHASERSYRTQLQKWGFLKYNTESNPRVRSRAVAKRAKVRPRATAQLIGQSHPVSSASTGSSSLSTFAPFPLNDINQQQWNFDTGLTVEGNSSTYTNIGYDQHIRSASVVPVPLDFGLDHVDGSGQTALHRATINKDIDQSRSLLEKGASVDIEDDRHNQPLHYAVMSNEPGLVRLLIRYGADRNAAGHLGYSPLHLAVSLSDPDVAELLLNEGASVNGQDDNGDSPLHLAVSLESWSTPSPDTRTYPIQLIDVLLRAKADVNILNKERFTPFHKLLSGDYSVEECAHMDKFIDLGASVDLPLPNGFSPFEMFLAKSKFPWPSSDQYGFKKSGLLQVFLQHGADPSTQLPSGEPLIVNFLSYGLIGGGYGNYSGVYSWQNLTFLGLVCTHVRLGPIKGNGNTTLHELALRCGKWGTSHKTPICAAMETLLKRGEDPNRRNLDGETPLLLLFTKRIEHKKSVLQCLTTLLSHGADPMILDLKGNAGLIAAAKMLNSGELESVLRADMGLKDSTPLVNRPESNGPSRFTWNEWEQSIREADWADAKTHLLRPSVNVPPEIAQKLRDSAFKVLAGKHIEVAKTQFQGESDANGKRRELVATVLRDCRLQRFQPEVRWIDYLLTLC